MLFWHSYFQYKKWYIIYLIKRCNKRQILISQTLAYKKNYNRKRNFSKFVHVKICTIIKNMSYYSLSHYMLQFDVRNQNSNIAPKLSSMIFNTQNDRKLINWCRRRFNTLHNICDGAFLQKKLKGFSCSLIFESQNENSRCKMKAIFIRSSNF